MLNVTSLFFILFLFCHYFIYYYFFSTGNLLQHLWECTNREFHFTRKLAHTFVNKVLESVIIFFAMCVIISDCEIFPSRCCWHSSGHEMEVRGSRRVDTVFRWTDDRSSTPGKAINLSKKACHQSKLISLFKTHTHTHTQPGVLAHRSI